MTLKPCPSRGFYLFQFLIILSLLGYAFYLEYYQDLIPCLLCVAQRIVFGAMGFLFFTAALFRFKRFWQVTVNFLVALFALFGMALSARQLWLQYLPPTEGTGSCDASMGYLWDILPLHDFIAAVFEGGQECAKVSWQFLHISLAGWSFLLFGAFLLLALWQFMGWALLPRKD